MNYAVTAQTILPKWRNPLTQPEIHVTIFDFNWIAQFIDYIDRKDTTTKGYCSCLRQFRRWAYENGVTQPNREDVKAYRDYLSQSELAPGTQAAYLRSVKQFFKWLASEGKYPNVADNIHGAKVRTDVHKRDAFMPKDIEKIAESIDRSDEQGKRLYAMFLICSVCGFRVVELSRLNVGDVEIVDGEVFLYVQGKGHDDKDAKVYLFPNIYEAITDYLNSRTAKPTPKSPLFTSTSNRSKDARIAPATISAMLKEMIVKAGYDSTRLSAHSLRHSAATAAHKCGLSLYEIQRLQRHSNPATTEIYIHDDETEKTEKKGRAVIYDYFFGNHELTAIIPELESEIMKLSVEDQKELLAQLRAQKGGNNERL